ncbi:MAG: hypothetical protein CMN30_08905 [Sandaracinus sp.]|nr:hypothetical protein [Sandaracinus sp.]|tara:strand:+ start:343 stop:2061 length:1719 start_codon:yes stop_codon:yes gene_type:complete
MRSPRAILWALTLTLAGGSLASAQVDPTDVPETNPNEGLTEPAATAPSVEDPDGTQPVPPAPQARQAVPMSRPEHETQCQDGMDDDGDGLTDCADSDCFENQACMFGGSEERNDQRCSDWVDNDGDGLLDCEDPDCTGPGLTVCLGSANHGAEGPERLQTPDPVPGLSGDQSVETLIGTGSDANGERNDYTCSDGVDNDGDGRVDCADFGCRFDPQVSVCTGSPGFRFSLVAGIAASYDLEQGTDWRTAGDVEFERLQVRVLGPIPYIANSFFLLSMQLEGNSPRLTFANFQVPIGDRGHYLSVNSGSGGLSTGFIVSQAKLPLLDRTFYMLNAFEQGNGAQIEQGGPLIPSGRLNYRVFLAGGKGQRTGNVGGRRTEGGLNNFAWAVGAQVGIDFVGHFNRFDSPMLYSRAPTTVALMIGAKYDQQPLERYPAANALFVFNHSIFQMRLENYFKYAIDFGGGVQNAWNAQVGVLLWPETLFLAADVGMFSGNEYDEAEIPPTAPNNALPRTNDVFRYRIALHWYWYRNIGMLSVLYDERHEDDPDFPTTGTIFDEDEQLEREIRMEMQFRF